MTIDEISFYPFNNKKGIIEEYKNGITQCYCVNTDGELLFKLPTHCTAIEVEDDNVIFVSDSNSKKEYCEALFDSNGNQLTDFVYKRIFGGSEEGFFEAEKDGKFGQLSNTGAEIVPFIYDESMYFTEGIAGMKLNGKWGMVDCQNNTVIPFVSEDIGFCKNNRISVKKNGKWGVIDKFNNVVIGYEFDELPYIFLGDRNCGSTYAKLGDKYGIIDIHGEILFDFIFEAVDCADDYGKWFSLKKDGKWALYSCEKNMFISPFMYDYIDYYENGIFNVQVNGKSFYVDTENRPIADENFECGKIFYGSTLIPFQKNGKYGVMNTGGKIIIEPKYEDKFEDYSDGMFVMLHNNFQEYVMDIEENIVLPKNKNLKFFNGFSDGIIATYYNGYYKNNGEKLELKFDF